jgi:hypothetical protein
MSMAIASVLGGGDFSLQKVFSDLDGSISEAKRAAGFDEGKDLSATDKERKQKRDLDKTVRNLKKLEGFLIMGSGGNSA